MDCIDRAVEALGLTEEAKKRPRVMREVKRRLAEFTRKHKDTGAGADPAVQQKLLESIEQIRIEAIIKKNQAIKNAEARMKMVERRLADYADSPEEAIRSLTVGSQTDRGFAKMSAAGVTSAAAHAEHARFVARIGPFQDYAGNPKNDRAIQNALYHLNGKVVDQQALDALPKEAVAVGRIIKEFQDKLQVRERAAGGHTGTLEHFVTWRHHDSAAIALAAGPGITDAKLHSQAWSNFLLERLDVDETFPGIPIDEVRQILARTYNTMSSRERVFSREAAAPGSTGAGRGGGSLAKSLAHRRVFKWKSADGEFEYFEKFGGGQPLIASVESGIRGRVQKIALMELLGPSPRENLHRFIDDTARFYGKKEGEGSARLTAIGLARQEADDLLDYLEGKSTKTWSPSIAKLGTNFRAVVSANALVRAGIAPFADGVFHTLTHGYYGDGRATTLGRTMANQIGGFIKAWTKDFAADVGEDLGSGASRYTQAERVNLSKLAVYTETLANLTAQVGEHTLGEPGFASSLYRFMLRYNRLQAVAERSRAAIVKAESHGLALSKGIAFDQLPEGTRRFLRHGGLGADDWDAMRRGTMTLDGETELLTLEAIDSLTPDQLKQHGRYRALETTLRDEREVFARDFKGKPETLATKLAELEEKHGARLERETGKIQRDMQNGMTVMFAELQALAANEPGPVERMSLRIGQRGTLKGELGDTVLMYKSFPMSVWRRHLDRMMRGYHGDGKMHMPRMLDAASLVAGSLVFGYATWMMKEMARNHTPPIPDDVDGTMKIMARSFLQAGGVPILGDFLFSDHSRYGRTPLTEAMGPGMGTLTDMLSVIRSVTVDRDAQDAGKNAMRLITRNAPGAAMAVPGLRVPAMLMNHAYTESLFNLLVGYHMDEYLSPGSVSREKQRLKKFKQAFLIEPRVGRR